MATPTATAALPPSTLAPGDGPLPMPPGPPPDPAFLALLPHDNAGPMLVIVIWVLIAIASLFLALRIYCKWLRRSGLWWDDYVLIGAWACITIESAVLTHAVQDLYYGIHIWDYPADSIFRVNRLVLAINVAGTFSLTAAIWSKTSFALTLLRLTEGWMRAIVWFIIITMNIGMGVSALLIWVQCTPIQKGWLPFIEGTCWPPYVLVNYDIFSAAYSAACDIALALLPWKLIWGLQMKKKEKLGVAIAMSMGVFAGITAIVKTTKIPRMLSGDTYDGVELFVWGNAESCVTIVAASIPVLRVLIREVRTSARRYYVSHDSANRTHRTDGGGGATKSGLGGSGVHGNPTAIGMKTMRSHTTTTVTARGSVSGLGGMGKGIGDDGDSNSDNTLAPANKGGHPAASSDDRSDKSILDMADSPTAVGPLSNNAGNRDPHYNIQSGRILRTDEIAVEYSRERKEDYNV